MKLVGRSLVSAMTHTPASGPFSPCTVPVMYPVGAPDCCARLGWAENVANRHRTPTDSTAILAFDLELVMELLLIKSVCIIAISVSRNDPEWKAPSRESTDSRAPPDLPAGSALPVVPMRKIIL